MINMTDRIQCQYCLYADEKEYTRQIDGFLTVTYTDGYYCNKTGEDVEPTSSCEKFKRRITIQI